MSIKWITKVWSDSPFDGTRLLIHLALADISHDDGRFFASQTDLAKKGRCTTQYVRLVINEMIEGGYIQIVTKGSSRGKATVYQLIHKELPNSVAESKIAEEGQLPNSVGDNSQTLTENSQTPSNNIRPIHPSLSTTSTSSSLVSLGLEEPLILANLLADRIEANGSKRPNVTQAWVKDMDKLIRIDGRTPLQVRLAIEWCQADSFWSTNILSPAKLRQKYDQLRLKASQQNAKRQPKGLKAIMEVMAEEQGKAHYAIQN